MPITLKDRYYAKGMVAPHYPVPAIRLEVDICKTWDNTVTIFDHDNYRIAAEWSKPNEHR